MKCSFPWTEGRCKSFVFILQLLKASMTFWWWGKPMWYVHFITFDMKWLMHLKWQFQNYSLTFSSTDLLDNLGASIIVSDRLTFLGKYREFHRLVHDSHFAQAASPLHSLLWSKLAPKYFWVTLLIDCIPFLMADQALFSALDACSVNEDTE